MANITKRQAELMEEIVTSLAAFGVTPNPVVGQENPSKKYTKDVYKNKERKVK